MSAWSIDLESANKFWWKILGGMERINKTDIDFERMTVWLQSSCTESYIYKNLITPTHQPTVYPDDDEHECLKFEKNYYSY